MATAARNKWKCAALHPLPEDSCLSKVYLWESSTWFREVRGAKIQQLPRTDQFCCWLCPNVSQNDLKKKCCCLSFGSAVSASTGLIYYCTYFWKLKKQHFSKRTSAWFNLHNNMWTKSYSKKAYWYIYWYRNHGFLASFDLCTPWCVYFLQIKMVEYQLMLSCLPLGWYIVVLLLGFFVDYSATYINK